MEKPWTNQYVEVDGIQTHYIEAGSGEPLLLIHGGGAASCAEVNYGAVMGPLSEHFRVIAVDNVGYGHTPGREPEHFAAEAQGQHLVKFMEALDLTAHVGGNSHGGWLGQYVAHEAPERVKRLIVINSLNGTQPIPPEPEGLKYVYGPKGHSHEEPNREKVREGLKKFFVDQSLVTDDRVELHYEIASKNHEYALKRAKARSASVDMLNEDLTYRGKHISEFADELNMPVLMTWSRENRGSTPEDAMAFFNRIPDVEMHVFPNAGHHVMTEHPERWTSVVTDFLKSER
ncbi:MAG: alpha/beta fold hydrolase [Clostridia bacterium]